jgi:hypothetical protein
LAMVPEPDSAVAAVRNFCKTSAKDYAYCLGNKIMSR